MMNLQNDVHSTPPLTLLAENSLAMLGEYCLKLRQNQSYPFGLSRDETLSEQNAALIHSLIDSRQETTIASAILPPNHNAINNLSANNPSLGSANNLNNNNNNNHHHNNDIHNSNNNSNDYNHVSANFNNPNMTLNHLCAQIWRSMAQDVEEAFSNVDSTMPDSVSTLHGNVPFGTSSLDNVDNTPIYDDSYLSPNVRFILIVFLCAMIGATVIGNILVCLSVILVRKLRHPSNYLLVSLAISDLCVAILVMPVALTYELSSSWRLTASMCDLWVSFDVTCCTSSILNLCTISIDRYLTITKPLTYGVKRTTRRMLLYIGAVWVASCLISIPPVLILGNEHGTPDSPICEVSQNMGYQIYATLSAFYIPLVVMIFVYYKIHGAAKRVVEAELRDQRPSCSSSTSANTALIKLRTSGGGGSLEPLPSLTNAQQCVIAIDNPKRIKRNKCCRILSVPFHRHERSSPIGLSEPSTHHFDCCCCFKSRTLSMNSLDNVNNNNPNNNNNGNSTVPAAASANNNNNGNNHHLSITVNKNIDSSPKNARRSTNHITLSVPNGTTKKKSISPSERSIHSTATVNYKRRASNALRERKASITLGIIMTAFTVCWLPFFILAILRPFSVSVMQIPRFVTSIALWLGYANSMLNPIIYVTFHQDFRRAFKHLLCFQCSSLGSRLRAEAYKSQYGGSHGHLSRVEMAKSKKYLNRPTSSLPEGVSTAGQFGTSQCSPATLQSQQHADGPRVQFQPDATSISGPEVAPFLSSPGMPDERDSFITPTYSASGFGMALQNAPVSTTAGTPSVAHSTRLTNTATTTMATGCAN